MNQLTETEKAYIAGFFDGEGCVSISKYQGKNNRTPVYSLQVVLAQKGIEPLFELQELTGAGTIHDRTKYHKGTYEWRMNARDANDFLIAIVSYLKCKRKQVELAIEYQSQQGHKKSGGKGWVVPQEMIDKKESYYLKLRELKGTSSIGRGRPKKRV